MLVSFVKLLIKWFLDSLTVPAQKQCGIAPCFSITRYRKIKIAKIVRIPLQPAFFLKPCYKMQRQISAYSARKKFQQTTNRFLFYALKQFIVIERWHCQTDKTFFRHHTDNFANEKYRKIKNRVNYEKLFVFAWCGWF